MNRGILGFPSGVGNAPLGLAATDAQAYEGISQQTIITPDTLRKTAFAFRRVQVSGGGGAGGGSAQFYPLNTFLDASATAGGIAIGYGPTSAGATNSLMSQTANTLDFRSRRWFMHRVKIEACASASGWLRFYFGNNVSTNAVDAQPSAACVGYELRGTAPRLWAIAHDGTTLTQVDTGIDLGGTGAINEFWVEANDGLASIYINGVLRSRISGGPRTLTGANCNFFAGNGGVASRTALMTTEVLFNSI